jgi:hypothetical protein
MTTIDYNAGTPSKIVTFLHVEAESRKLETKRPSVVRYITAVALKFLSSSSELQVQNRKLTISRLGRNDTPDADGADSHGNEDHFS